MPLPVVAGVAAKSVGKILLKQAPKLLGQAGKLFSKLSKNMGGQKSQIMNNMSSKINDPQLKSKILEHIKNPEKLANDVDTINLFKQGFDKLTGNDQKGLIDNMEGMLKLDDKNFSFS